MLNTMKFQLSIMMAKKEFKISFLVIFLYCIISFVYAAISQWGLDGAYVLSANALFCGNAYSKTWYYFIYLFSFSIVLPFSSSHINDIECGITPFILTKSTRKEYYLTKIFVCFIGGFIIIFIPFLLNLALCHLTFPNNMNYQFGEYGMPNFFRTILGTNLSYNTEQKIIPFIKLFLNSPTIYNIVYICILSIVSGIFSVFLLCITYLKKLHRAILFVPIYVIVLFSSVISEYGFSRAINDYKQIFVNYDIMDYLVAFGFSGKSVIYISVFFSIIALFCIFSYLKIINSDEFTD